MIIMLCLLPMIVLTFISVIFGSEFTSVIVERELTDLFKINGTIPEWLNVEKITTTTHFSIIEGAIAIIIIVVSITVIFGIRLLGSGLSETTVKNLTIGIAYTGIWLVLSALAFPLLNSIEIFGNLIYIALTIGYVVGVIEKLSGVV